MSLTTTVIQEDSFVTGSCPYPLLTKTRLHATGRNTVYWKHGLHFEKQNVKSSTFNLLGVPA